MSKNEELEILKEKLLQYQESNAEMTNSNKHLKDENNELLERVQTLQNHTIELKSR